MSCGKSFEGKGNKLARRCAFLGSSAWGGQCLLPLKLGEHGFGVDVGGIELKCFRVVRLG